MLGNSAESDQTPHSVASDPGLHCLPMSSKKNIYGLTRLVRMEIKFLLNWNSTFSILKLDR